MKEVNIDQKFFILVINKKKLLMKVFLYRNFYKFLSFF